MPPFPKSNTSYSFDPADEISALRTWCDTEPGRKILSRDAGSFLLGSWNIANFGDAEQERE
ncbi:MAG: hypothetical protein AAF217_08905 [Pseudomonadota bacterium]